MKHIPSFQTSYGSQRTVNIPPSIAASVVNSATRYEVVDTISRTERELGLSLDLKCNMTWSWTYTDGNEILAR
jgi:hypothetical protein